LDKELGLAHPQAYDVRVLQAVIRAPITKAITPLCRGMLRVGISANLLSVMGGIGSTLSSILFFSSGRFVSGVIFTLFFILFDLFDGTLARLSESGSSKWGALLDSSLDRLSDSAIIGSLIVFLLKSHDPLVPVLVAGLLTGGLVSYIKAKSEGFRIACDGGLAERAERLTIILGSLFLAGLGLPYALAVGSWALLIVSLYTVYQRSLIFRQGSFG
jgi:CDP-diacylglycerol--glycerol-3-phosphate 3-phosphatidyltransferase